MYAVPTTKEPPADSDGRGEGEQEREEGQDRGQEDTDGGCPALPQVSMELLELQLT